MIFALDNAGSFNGSKSSNGRNRFPAELATLDPDGADAEIALGTELAIDADGFDARAPATLELTPRIFAADGWLHSLLGLEHRPQQAALANAIARAFAGDAPLLAEAGTGVGKSIAYLVPGLIHAIDAGRQLVVSTHTIPLQNQIQNNDLPKCRALFESVPELRRYSEFKHALLIGRANYLCTTRLARAIAQHGDLLDTAQKTELLKLQEWARHSEEGHHEEIRDSVSHEVWEWVNADSSVCNPRNCRPDTCPYQRAKARLASANLIIVNHALLLSLIAAGAAPKENTRGILYAGDFVVLDEAHRIPDVATDHLGASVTAYAIERQLYKLWNPKKSKGLFLNYGAKKEDLNLVMEIASATEFFFNDIHARFLEQQSISRLLKKNWAEPLLNLPITRLCARLGDLMRLERDNNRSDEFADIRRRLLHINDTINDAVALGTIPKFVYWVERHGARQNVSINAAPLDVAAELRTHLFARQTGAVLTSATLTDGSDMNRFKKLTGAEAVPDLIEKSPFDYEKNMQIFIAGDGPLPEEKGKRDCSWLADVSQIAIESIAGGTLLLCTSHGDVRKLHEALTKSLAGKRTVLAQLAGKNRSQLVEDFRTAGNAVLIGTDSFWTGVDVPGPALSQVIIARLPFEQPTHPIVEARTEWIREQGKKPFDEMTLPAALIKFRQGIGRLIRKTDDRGRVVILDSRVLVRPYGRHFVSALPHKNFKRFTRETMRTVLGCPAAR